MLKDYQIGLVWNNASEVSVRILKSHFEAQEHCYSHDFICQL